MSLKRSILIAALSTALLLGGHASAAPQPLVSPSAWAQQQGTTQLSLNDILQSAPTSVTQALNTRLQAIRDTASTKGEARVVVRLQTGFTPEGQLVGAQVQTQRNSIQTAQSKVIEALRINAGMNQQQFKRFDTIPFLAMSLTPQALNTLAATPGVIDIQPDRLNRANLAHSVPLIGGATATALGITGQGQAVAILDTGVDKNHPFLSGKVISEACYSTNDTQSGSISVCPGGIEASTSSGSGVNCASNIAGCEHGTHVAGIAAGKNNNFHGVAPEAKVIAVQVFSRFPSDYCSPGEDYCALSWTSDQILGLERIYALRGSYQIAAVNMSLGGGYWERQDHCDIDNEAEKLAIDNLRSAGIATVIASGNDGYWWGMGAPGCISSAISVGSSTSNAQGLSDNLVSDFSNSVNFLDVLAPGETINSSVPGSGYQAWNGTSMAAPHVAGTFALLKQRYPGQNVASLEALLKNTGTLITDSRNGVTTPRINLAYALATPTKATQLDISQIYLAGFLRAPELGGFNYWKGLNKTPETLATDIFNLPVVKQIYPDSMSNSAFVTAIYNNVFGRSPDSGGLNYWLGQLQGMTRGELVLTMIRAGMGVPDATEGKAFLVNRLLVTAYALNQQLGHQIELQPGDLQFAQSIVNDETTSVQLGYEVIDWMMHLAQ